MVIPLGAKLPRHSESSLPRETAGIWGGTEDGKGFTSTQTGTQGFRSYVMTYRQCVIQDAGRDRSSSPEPVS